MHIPIIMTLILQTSLHFSHVLSASINPPPTHNLKARASQNRTLTWADCTKLPAGSIKIDTDHTFLFTGYWSPSNTEICIDILDYTASRAVGQFFSDTFDPQRGVRILNVRHEPETKGMLSFRPRYSGPGLILTISIRGKFHGRVIPHEVFNVEYRFGEGVSEGIGSNGGRRGNGTVVGGGEEEGEVMGVVQSIV